MAMLISADKYKERGLDKATAQVKVNAYIQNLAEQIRKVKV